MKSITFKLTVPDDVEPFDVLNNMIATSSMTTEFSPHIENITIEVVKMGFFPSEEEE